MTDLPPRTFWESVRGVFVRGFVVLVPVYLTIWFFQAFLNAVDGILSPILDRLVGRPIPGLGFLSVLVLLFLVGLLTRNLVGRLVFGWIERFISSLPFVRSVYGAIKDLVDAINVAGGKGRSFRRVVMVQYPRLGVYSVGFVTNESVYAPSSGEDVQLVNVYIMSPPNPTAGVLILVPRADVIPLNMTIEQGLKFVLSGGIVTPEKLTRLPSL